jgi:hypothetical protein
MKTLRGMRIRDLLHGNRQGSSAQAFYQHWVLSIHRAYAIDDRRVLILRVRGKRFHIRWAHARGLRRGYRTGLQQRRQRRVGSTAGKFRDHCRSESRHQAVQYARLLLAIPIGE